MASKMLYIAFSTAIITAALSLFAPRPAWAPANDQPEQITATGPNWDRKPMRKITRVFVEERAQRQWKRRAALRR